MLRFLCCVGLMSLSLPHKVFNTGFCMMAWHGKFTWELHGVHTTVEFEFMVQVDDLLMLSKIKESSVMRWNDDKQLSGIGGFFSYYLFLCYAAYANTFNGISYIDGLSISILLSLEVWFAFETNIKHI